MRSEQDAVEIEFKALMIEALGGNGPAYEKLLKALTPHLRSYFARRLNRAAEAEDLVQETLIAIHTKRDSFDASQPFTAWLHAIARYKLIDHFRRAGIRKTLPLEEAESVVAGSDTVAAEASRDLGEVLKHLPQARRELLRQVKLEGLSTAEAAARFGISESAVKVGIHRSLKTLMAKFGGAK